MVADNIEERNVGSEVTINKGELCKAITILKSEEEEGHERNIDNMTQEDDYKSPWKEKDVTTVNNTLDDTAFTFKIHSRMIQVIRVNRLRRVKRQSKILRRINIQSQILTLST